MEVDVNLQMADNNIQQSESSRPASEVLSWDDYFMGAACLSARRSKDPHTQVGACIVNKNNRIVGLGYNGMPNDCSGCFPWSRDESLPWLERKYPYVCHAEMNAIMNKNSASLDECRIYVSLFPCNECAKLIIQSGIKKVIYASDKYRNEDATIAAKRMLERAGIKYRQHIPQNNTIVIDFNAIEE